MLVFIAVINNEQVFYFVTPKKTSTFAAKPYA